MITPFIVACVFIAGLVVGAVKGWDIGEERGRAKERRQVRAFLIVTGDEDAARRIDEGEHLRYDISSKPPRMGAT